MEEAVDQFQRFEMGNLEAEEFDTCMMDPVLRRQVLETPYGLTPSISTAHLKCRGVWRYRAK